jgi:hypothetical protein
MNQTHELENLPVATYNGLCKKWLYKLANTDCTIIGPKTKIAKKGLYNAILYRINPAPTEESNTARGSTISRPYAPYC